MRSVFSERQLITQGPAKGIYVGEDMYNRYTGLCDVIDDYVTNTDRVYIIESAYYCSFGYLHQKGEYATYSPRGHYFDRIVDYWDVDKEKMPTVIIISKAYIDEKGYADFPTGQKIDTFLKVNNYIRTETQDFIVYK